MISLKFQLVPPEDIQKGLGANNYELTRSYLEFSDMVDYLPFMVKRTTVRAPYLMSEELNDITRGEMNFTLEILREE